MITKYNNHPKVWCINESKQNVIFYLHGGGFQYEMAPYYFDFFERLSQATNSKIIVPVYPKAPKYKDHEIIDFIIDIFQQVKQDSNNIIIIGDSAGGTLAYILNQIDDFAKYIITISPWTNLYTNNPQISEIAPKDNFLSQKLLQRFASEFCEKYTLDSEIINPIYMHIAHPEKHYIMMGTNDILYPDALMFATKNNIDIKIYDTAPHCFALLEQYSEAFNDLVIKIKKLNIFV